MIRHFQNDRKTHSGIFARASAWFTAVILSLGIGGSAMAGSTSNELEAYVRPQLASPAKLFGPKAETSKQVTLPTFLSTKPSVTAPATIAPVFAPTATASATRRPVCSLQAQPVIMSALAKMMSKPEFERPIATYTISNTTAQSLQDLRARCRVEGFSSWTKWHRAGDLATGNSATFKFNPIFDLEKLADLNGARSVKLEVEFSYFGADGKEIADADAAVTQLLGRNLVHYSSRQSNQNKNFKEAFDISHLVLASFVTTDDPVMQALAGEVSNLAGIGGVGAGYTDQEATKFATAMFDYMKQKQIAYTSPTSRMIEGFMVQHIKFGRDVLRNRSGTCIDLAITYGSVFEAVGLEPVLCLIPGHCFPALVLPQSRKILPLEATLLKDESFTKAVELAQANFDKHNAAGTLIAVNIQKVRDQGVQSTELAKLEMNDIRTLTRLDNPRRLAPSTTSVSVVAPTTTTTRDTNTRTVSVDVPKPDQQPVVAPVVADSAPVGTWLFRNFIDGVWVEMGITLLSNGEYAVVTRVAGNTDFVTETGSYKVEGDILNVQPSDKTGYTAKFRVSEGKLEIYFGDLNRWLWFQKKA